MRINLNDIPTEGKQFKFTQADGKITPVMQDLIGQEDFSFDITIRPLGNAFEVKGEGHSFADEVCSKCGWDLHLPIDKKIHEYLVIEEARPRKSHSTHGNQSLDLEQNGPDTTYLKSQQFNVGEFLHEQLALSWPEYPQCGTQECQARQSLHQDLFVAEATEDKKPLGHPAFSVLHKVKGEIS